MSDHTLDPCVAGVAAITQRDTSRTAIELMVAAAEQAAIDAGSTRLLDAVDWIGVPEGIWTYSDPGALIAGALGLGDVHTVRADVGVLQQTLLSAACEAVASGRAEVALVAGGEDRARAREHGEPDRPESEPPSEHLRPAGDILADIEIERELAVPAHQYAVIESAIAHQAGRTRAEHEAVLSQLDASLRATAAGNPWAWQPEAATPDFVVAEPYRRRHISQWTVDQAAAVIITAPERAAALGLGRDRLVFAVSAAESNVMVPLSARPDLARSPGFELAATAALRAAEVSIDDIGVVELYSCFPAALELQAAALGLGPDRALTLTGGMAAAGGPLNNFVLMALERVVAALRAGPDAIGMITSISGMATKAGLGLWSARPPATRFAGVDVSPADHGPACPIDPNLTGPVEIVGATVLHDREGPRAAVVVAESTDGRRTVATSDRPTAIAVSGDDMVGRTVTVAPAGHLVV